MKRSKNLSSPFDNLASEYDAWFDKEGSLIFFVEVQAFKDAATATARYPTAARSLLEEYKKRVPKKGDELNRLKDEYVDLAFEADQGFASYWPAWLKAQEHDKLAKEQGFQSISDDVQEDAWVDSLKRYEQAMDEGYYDDAKEWVFRLNQIKPGSFDSRSDFICQK